MGADLGDTTPKGQSLGSTLRLLTREPVHLTALLSHPAQGVASKRNYLSWSEVREQSHQQPFWRTGVAPRFSCARRVFCLFKRGNRTSVERRDTRSVDR